MCFVCLVRKIYQQSRIISMVKSSGCVNRSDDYHSVPTSQDFVLGEFFVSSVSSHSISSRVNSKLDNFKFSNSISPKHVCTHVKFTGFAKSQKIPKVITDVNPSKTRIPKNQFRRSKTARASRTRAPARTRTRGIYINIIRRTSIYIFPKGKIYIY